MGEGEKKKESMCGKRIHPVCQATSDRSMADIHTRPFSARDSLDLKRMWCTTLMTSLIFFGVSSTLPARNRHVAPMIWQSARPSTMVHATGDRSVSAECSSHIGKAWHKVRTYEFVITLERLPGIESMEERDGSSYGQLWAAQVAKENNLMSVPILSRSRVVPARVRARTTQHTAATTRHRGCTK